MSINTLPTELLYEVVSNLTAGDILSLILTSRQLHGILIHTIYRLACCHRLAHPRSLTDGLGDVSFWHDKEGNGTILEWAAIHHQVFTFRRLLIEPGIDMIQQDCYGVTLLHRLAGQGKVEFMRPLIEKLVHDDIDPYASDLSCLTPLHFAAGCGRVDAVEVMISLGANICAKDRYGNTPLHLAAVTGSWKVFGSLIKAGADINSETRFGWAPIDQASIGHHDTAVARLLWLGSRPPRWEKKQYGLNEYLRLSPCPLEYYFENLDFS